jgi:hypothetical protein
MVLNVNVPGTADTSKAIRDESTGQLFYSAVTILHI